MQGVRWTDEDLAAHRAKMAGHKAATGVVARPAGATRIPAGPPAAPVSARTESSAGLEVGGPDATPESSAVAGALGPIPKRKRRHPEQDFQKDCIKFLDAALMPYWRVVHVPNGGTTGGHKAKIIGGIRKAMGLREGYPDLTLLGPNRFVVIELKAPGTRGGLSDAQKEWRDWFQHIGMHWFLVRSHDELVAACQDAGVPLRVRQ
jgi:hypothetical protein